MQPLHQEKRRKREPLLPSIRNAPAYGAFKLFGQNERSPLHVLHIVDKVGLGVVRADRGDLPVQLTVVDHGKNRQRLDRVHSPHRALLAADLNNIHRIVVSLRLGQREQARFQFWEPKQAQNLDAGK